ncbi:MAG TPA: hypothetical protein VK173_05815 [Lacibacter sp.]|nr:hypothetical protein [Lacibacter sp.]
MKKFIITAIILIAANFSFGQNSLYSRYVNANKDSIRVQLRMAVLDHAEAQVDTATKKNERLCKDALIALGSGWFTDVFAFMYAVKENDAVPTDSKIKTFVASVWMRVAELNTRR